MTGISPDGQEARDGAETLGGPELVIAPALFDIQVNGFAGHDLNGEDTTEDDVFGVAEAMYRSGCGLLCPTIGSGTPERMCRSLRAVATACEDTTLANSVPAVHLAKRILLPAATEEGEAVFLADPEAEGVSLVRQATSRKEPVFEVTLAGVSASEDDVLRGEDITAWITERASVALAALQSGVSERALEITTDYVKEREQFGGPLGALPAVQHRCSNCYIDLESMRWVMWSAAWKLATDRPATRDALIAKFWAADGGSRIATATQHLHGGMGVDLDYPIHRYFLWTKTLELALGAATPQLVKLGRDMARTGPQELA